MTQTFPDLRAKPRQAFRGHARSIAGFMWVLSLLPLPALAQNALENPYFYPKMAPQAPATAELGKYGDYTVNLMHGLPSISIPLYEVQAGELSVPITLNYHASGIKVTDVASWAGQGWSLDAGGAIMRTVMGGPDESSAGGYLAGNLKTTSQIDPYTTAGFQYLADVMYGHIDAQPDIFSYSFPGKSGKFFFNGQDNFSIEKVPFSPILISKEQTNSTTLSFGIVDEKGNRFSFGRNYRESVSSDNGGEVTPPANSAWMLEEMISQSRRDTIAFSYASSSGTTNSGVEDMYIVTDKPQPHSVSYGWTSSIRQVTKSVSTWATEQRLQEISFRHGRVVFLEAPEEREDFHGPSKKRLEAVEVHAYDVGSKSFRLHRRVTFFHSYFISDMDDSGRQYKRLRLDSLSVSDGAGETIQRYRFEYNEDVKLPGHHSLARDYWGYYNGKKNRSLVPGKNIDFIQGMDSSNPPTEPIGSTVPNGREPDSDLMQAFTLKRIYYPTGGHTDFAFEANRYYDQTEAVVKLAGGLRVKSIKSYDGVSPAPVVKTYEYTSARKNFFLSDYHFWVEQTYYHWGTVSGGPELEYSQRIRTFLPTPSINIVPYDACPVVYPTVTEYFGDGTVNTGKVEHVFYDQTDAPNTTQLVNKPVNDSYFFRRGQPRIKTTLANTGGDYSVVKLDSSDYFAYPLRANYNVGLVVGKRSVHGGEAPTDLSPETPHVLIFREESQWVFTNYTIFSGDQYLTGVRETAYDLNGGGTPVTRSTSYAYGNISHQQPTRVTTRDSKGKTRVVTGKYAADFLPAGGASTGNPVLDGMLSRNMHASLVERQERVADGASEGLVTGAQLNLHKAGPHGAILLERQKNLEADRPLPDFTPSAVVNGELQADSRYTQQIGYGHDRHGNVQTVTRDEGAPVSYLWGYRSSLPIAQVTPARVETVEEAVPAQKDLSIILTSGATQDTPLSSAPLALDKDQTVSLSYQVTKWGAVEDVTFSVIIKDAAGDEVISRVFYNLPQTVSFHLAAGTYTFFYRADLYPAGGGGARPDILLAYERTQVAQNVFHTSFEDEGVESATAKTGRNVHRGNYSLSLPPIPGQYEVSYWRRPWGGVEWTYVRELVEVTTTSAPSVPIGDSGSEVDEVRLHPLHAQMTTYTYDPHVGLTSETDASGRTTYYGYDGFGRLAAVRDEEGNILRTYCYNYAGQEADCTTGTASSAGQAPPDH